MGELAVWAETRRDIPRSDAKRTPLDVMLGTGSMKLGRNEKCWCGSNRKYKDCHYDRERQAPRPVWEVEKAFRAEFKRELCSSPSNWHKDCSGTIVRAHTVPKSSSLKKIASNGHVYAFVPSLKNLQKWNGILRPELVGVNRASTFTGFCSKHDNEIFSPIEDSNFSGSSEQCFLLAYRAVARETYTKMAANNLAPLRNDLDKGRSVQAQQGIQEFNRYHNLGLQAGVRDSNFHKAKYDACLEAKDYSTTRAYIVEFEYPPTVMCAGGNFPTEDFNGVELQDLSDLSKTPDSMTFTSFWGGEAGYVVFSWIDEGKSAARTFIRSLEAIPDSKISSALIRFFFEVCENVHIQPKWWTGLEQKKRDALISRMAVSADPFAFDKLGGLRDDGVEFADWKVKSRRTLNLIPSN